MIPTRVNSESGPAAFAEILNELPDFWDGRDLRPLHQPFWLRQCAADALVIRDQQTLVGYLLGVLTAHRLGYVHLIAIRRSHRKRGLGSQLYSRFLDTAHDLGVHRVEAITMPTNTGSIAFHQRVGFTTELIPDYAGPDQPRVLFRLSLTPTTSDTRTRRR